MSPAQASRIVLIAGGLEAVFVLARARRGSLKEGDTYKSLWAIGLLTLGLSILADFIPEIAGPFALLVLIAMAVRSRGELGQVLGVASPTPVAPAAVYPSTTRLREARR